MFNKGCSVLFKGFLTDPNLLKYINISPFCSPKGIFFIKSQYCPVDMAWDKVVLYSYDAKVTTLGTPLEEKSS